MMSRIAANEELAAGFIVGWVSEAQPTKMEARCGGLRFANPPYEPYPKGFPKQLTSRNHATSIRTLNDSTDLRPGGRFDTRR